MSMRYAAGFISAFYNPLKNPDAPTIGTATKGDTSASVAFTAPSNVGGSAITSYTVISTPSGITASGTSSPIVVTGLTNGTAYTFKVLATNSYGSSPLSEASNSVTPSLSIGDAYAGGFYAGQIGVSGVATHNLVVAPISSGQFGPAVWKNAFSSTAGSESVIDGPQNTADMVADGSSTVYPCAHFCNDAVIGGYTDWYMPAQNEVEVCYFNLKPTTTTNSTSSGINPNAVPARASNYTSGTPARTLSAAFQSGGAQAFGTESYWSSTEASGYTSARAQSFFDGIQYSEDKNDSLRVRAIRRVAV